MVHHTNKMLLSLVLSLFYSFALGAVDKGQGCCGECWCITDYTSLDNGTVVPGTCPIRTTAYPQLYTEDMVSDYSSKTLIDSNGDAVENLFTLECNPYEGVSKETNWQPYQGCLTSPPQMFNSTTESGYDEAVCAYKYPNFDADGNCNTYTYQTYASIEEAEADNAYVTHMTQCGACSTAQDLAVYLENPDLTSLGEKCGILVLSNITKAVKCYMSAGFTETCAYVWAADGQLDQEHCLATCTLSINASAVGPAPQCALNKCLSCDAEKSTPTFNAYAGRTRRNSGIWSATPRQCSSIVNLQQNTCPPINIIKNETICEEQQVCSSPNPLLSTCAPSSVPIEPTTAPVTNSPTNGKDDICSIVPIPCSNNKDCRERGCGEHTCDTRYKPGVEGYDGTCTLAEANYRVSKCKVRPRNDMGGERYASCDSSRD